jgi:hypothetical protein
LVASRHLDIIAHGGVAILPNWLPEDLTNNMKRDARVLFDAGFFTPDGLTNTAIAKDQQGFSPRADRQTFRGGDGWDDESAGDHGTRIEFANLMTALRLELAQGLDRPTMGLGGDRKHEMTYNWYEPGAMLGRHLDEHHEETKGPKGWQMPTRRSVTWLVYLNDGWTKDDGGVLHCYPRRSRSSAPVGADQGNLQVGWMDDVHPVFLESWREESGLSALYTLTFDMRPSAKRNYVSAGDFNMPHQPIEFQTFLRREYRQGRRFEQISTARRDPRFVDSTQQLVSSSASTENESYPVHVIDVVPAAGTLVLFDSVTLPHLVQEVTGPRQRIAATGWFHEDNQALPL